MPERHTMTVAYSYPGERRLVCADGCGRAVVIGPGRFDVLDQGDFYALHSYRDDLGVSVGVEQ